MVRKKLILLAVLYSTTAFSMTLTGDNKILVFEKSKSGYFLSTKCQDCMAQKTFEIKDKKQFLKILSTEKNRSLPLSARLCLGLNGSIWLLDDENKKEQSVCEFSDKSYLLSDELAKHARLYGAD